MEANFLKILQSNEVNPGTSISSILKMSAEIDEDEQSRLFEEWISSYSILIAKVYSKSAYALVSSSSSDFHALENAIDRAKIARRLDPDNPNHVELLKALATYKSISSSIHDEEYEADIQGELLSREALYALNDAHRKAFHERESYLAALLAKRILDELERRTDTQDFEVAIWQNNLGVDLSMSGQGELSLYYYEQAHQVSETRVDEEGRTVHRISYGIELARAGRYQEALALLDAANDDAVRIFGPDHRNVRACELTRASVREVLSEEQHVPVVE